MKPNQEISLKFWITMIVFFAVVLSSPIISYLITNSIIDYTDAIAFYFVCFAFFACFYMILALRHSELKQKLSKETFFNKVSAQTITDYDEQIKAQESKINDLKQAFEDAVAEITEHRSRIKTYQERQEKYELLINKLNDQITYWKERALHVKHTKKEVESDMWECIYNIYAPEFINGNKYEDDKSKNSFSNVLFLIGESKCTCLVERKYFKPVKC